jgi:hypothetical protein
MDWMKLKESNNIRNLSENNLKSLLLQKKSQLEKCQSGNNSLCNSDKQCKLEMNQVLEVARVVLITRNKWNLLMMVGLNASIVVVNSMMMCLQDICHIVKLNTEPMQ